VKVEQQFSFAFLDKWIFSLDLFFFIPKVLRCYYLGGGLWQLLRLLTDFLTPEERRHALHVSMSIGVNGRRVPGLDLLVSHVWLRIDGQ
jgi:hypothetical protein